MKILVICGAGASSTFVALRMRQTAAQRGLAVDVVAASESDLPDALTDIDVLLVGPHLAPRFDEIRTQADSAGVGCALLPATVFTARDGGEALDAAEQSRISRSERLDSRGPTGTAGHSTWKETR